MVGRDALSAAERTGLKGPAGHFFINTTWQDIEQYNCLRLQAARLASSYRPSSSGSWGQPEHETSHLELIRHCKLRLAYPPKLTCHSKA